MTLDELDSAREWMLLLGRKTAREKIASLFVIMARRDAALNTSQPGDGLRFPLLHHPRSDGRLPRADHRDREPADFGAEARKVIELERQADGRRAGLRCPARRNRRRFRRRRFWPEGARPANVTLQPIGRVITSRCETSDKSDITTGLFPWRSEFSPREDLAREPRDLIWINVRRCD